MISFLHSVARGYASRYGDLSDFCFVFPNKRSATFFLSKLRQEACDHPMVAPETTSIAELAQALSDRLVDDRIDLLFRLYIVYCRKLGQSPDDQSEEAVTFDSFCSWGEIALSDFNEVDMYGVDPASLFKNLTDLREIAADYLTDEQKRLMEEYFDYQPGSSGADSFWQSFEPIENMSGVKKNFLYLWQTLGELYSELHAGLEKEGLTTIGGSYRLAFENMQKEDFRERLSWKKMVFVGFNALSLAEKRIFSRFQEMEGPSGPDGPEPLADFLWDGTGVILGEEPLIERSSAARFLNSNRREFPSPQWMEPFLHLSDASGIPERIHVVSSPSNSLQAKIIGNQIREWYPDYIDSLTLDPENRDPKIRNPFRDASVAVVLPDENLLLPLLYSLPKGLKDVNLTMGYPLRLTATLSFASLYRQLQLHVGHSSRGLYFFRKDVERILGHPYSHAVLGAAKVAQINTRIAELHRHAFYPQDYADIAPLITDFLIPLPHKAPAAEGARNLDTLLALIDSQLQEHSGGVVVKARLDREHIAKYRNALARLMDSVEEHSISLSAHTFFRLADRLLGNEHVRFKGEPLSGLQIMGMLETRALDFERIIIPSANEKILPLKGRTRSFIPNSLRAAYGMPPMEHQENLASYYFYRLISRAKEVILLYDSRTGGGSGGNDISRYILQLKHLYAPGRFTFEEKSFSIEPSRPRIEQILKTPFIQERLRSFLDRSQKRYMSATALETYLGCGIKFFYERLMNIKTDTEPSEYIDHKTQGDVVHEVMMQLYMPQGQEGKLLKRPMLVTGEMIRKILDRPEALLRLVSRSINRHHYHLDESRLDSPLPGAAGLVAPRLAKWICDVLLHDMAYTPFSILGLELSNTVPYRFGDGKEVNMKFIIDRLDMITGPDGKEIVRIVDYKTGSSVEMDFSEFDLREAAEDYRKKPAIQLLLYAELLNRWLLSNSMDEKDPELVIYHIPEMEGQKAERRIRLEDPQASTPAKRAFREQTFRDLDQTFRQQLDSVFSELFDPEVPFKAAENPDVCRFCELRTLCGR